MKIVFAVLLLSLSVGSFAQNCTLYKGLQLTGLKATQLAQLMCIANQVSILTQQGAKSDTNYGRFWISSTTGCNDPKNPGKNICNIDCDKLGGNDLNDDIQCAVNVMRNYGIDSWNMFKPQCKKARLGRYLRGCRLRC